MVTEAEGRTNELEHKMMIERVQCGDAGMDSPSPAPSPAMSPAMSSAMSPAGLIGEARFVDGGSAQRNADAGAGFTDGGRVVRARRVLAMAETLAWSGLGAKLSGEEVVGEEVVGEEVASEEFASEEVASEEVASEEVVYRKTESKAERETGHDKTAEGRQQKPAPRIRRGKQQRAQQCARDVKRFLARRDAGEPRQTGANADDGEVVRVDRAQDCRRRHDGVGAGGVGAEGVGAEGVGVLERFAMDRKLNQLQIRVLCIHEALLVG